jgi:hypothetical protein
MSDLTIPRRDFLKIGGGLAALVASYSACKMLGNDAKYEGFRQHPVDMVFEDPDGCRVYYKLKTGEPVEVKYFDHTLLRDRGIKQIENIPKDVRAKFGEIDKDSIKKGVVVIKDLKPEERGYANVVVYKERLNFSGMEYTFVEVHIPANQEVSSGRENPRNKTFREFIRGK